MRFNADGGETLPPRCAFELYYWDAEGGTPSSSRFMRHRHDAPAQYDLGRTLYPHPPLDSCCSGGGSCLATGPGTGWGGGNTTAGVGGGAGAGIDTAGIGAGVTGTKGCCGALAGAPAVR